MNKLSNQLKEKATDLLFPKFCLGCQKEGTYLCQDCLHLLEIMEGNYCLCQKPLPLPANSLSGKCRSCQDKRLSGLLFAMSYKNNIAKKLIRQFKYPPYLKDLSKTIASILLEHFILCQKNKDIFWENSVLVAVPLHKKKIKTRGYNQSEELAKELSVVLKVPVLLDVLIKTKQTKPQMELSKEDRHKNLSDSFATANAEKIKNKKVFLVDDVYTTGSTMEECAKVLRKAGAKQVWGIAIAREE